MFSMRRRSSGVIVEMRSVSCRKMAVAGRAIPFSGGGYLRLFPDALTDAGFAQNHRAGRPVMAYIHPREIDVEQPRMNLPWLRGFQYYVGLADCERKLRRMLARYAFGSCQQVLAAHPPRETWRYRAGVMSRVDAAASA